MNNEKKEVRGAKGKKIFTKTGPRLGSIAAREAVNLKGKVVEKLFDVIDRDGIATKVLMTIIL